MLAVLLAALVLQDPDAVLKEMRSAQAAFERQRRFNLPRTNSEGNQRCDERIGEFCYWYDGREQLFLDEGPVIAGQREALLVELGAAAQRLPEDPWLRGQQVRYLLEAGRPGEALALSDACAGHDAWCTMLRGLVLHRTGEVLEADSAFSRALKLLPAAERCGWLDLSLLLPGAHARRWRDLPCADQAAETERWLGLGRPLLALPGNSVRTEFLSRQVMVRIADGTLTPYGSRFNRDHREMVLRYGWPVSWSQVPGRGVGQDASITGHDPTPAWGFLPVQVEDPAWDLHGDRPRGRFKPPGMVAIFAVEDAQLVRLPREDGALLVAAWQLPPAHPLNTAGVTGVLAEKAHGRAPGIAIQLEDGRGGGASARVARDIVEAGLELLGLDGGTWARFRAVWAEPLATSGPVLSDLLLFDPWQGVPEELEAVLPHMLRGSTVRRGGTIGVYWEWRDLPAGADTTTVQIQIGPIGGGAPLLAWSWQPSRPGSRGGSGSMALDLGRLGRGDFYLDVLMTLEGRTLRSRRTIRVD